MTSSIPSLRTGASTGSRLGIAGATSGCCSGVGPARLGEADGDPRQRDARQPLAWTLVRSLRWCVREELHLTTERALSTGESAAAPRGRGGWVEFRARLGPCRAASASSRANFTASTSLASAGPDAPLV
jgi:hypothetical protein